MFEKELRASYPGLVKKLMAIYPGDSANRSVQLVLAMWRTMVYYDFPEPHHIQFNRYGRVVTFYYKSRLELVSLDVFHQGHTYVGSDNGHRYDIFSSSSLNSFLELKECILKILELGK